MYLTKSRMINKRSVLESDWETDATWWVVLGDQDCLAESSSILGSSTFTCGKVFVGVETSLDRSTRGNKSLVAGRQFMQDASTILSVWSSVAMQKWCAEARARLFKVWTAETSCPSLKEHAELTREDDDRVDNFTTRSKQTFCHEYLPIMRTVFYEAANHIESLWKIWDQTTPSLWTATIRNSHRIPIDGFHYWYWMG